MSRYGEEPDCRCSLGFYCGCESLKAPVPEAVEKAVENLRDNQWEKIGEASVNEFGEPVPAVMKAIVDKFAPEEQRYEAIDLILKSRADGEAWFDVIHDYLTQDCDSVELEDGVWTPCQCGMESMGGTGGTLDQCYAWKTNLGNGIQPLDVARVIDFLASPNTAPYVSPADRVKIIDWARKEIEFEEYFENRTEQDDEI